MREMKNSGIEWIGEIPKDWETISLKKIANFNKGLSITKADLIEDGICVVNYGQIHSKVNNGFRINEKMVRYINELYLNSNEKSKVQYGDIVFADTSEDYDGIGNSVYIDSDRISFAGYHTVIMRVNDNIYSKYLSFLFLTDCWRSQLRSQATGIKVFSITQKMLKNALVIIPPLEKQQRIAEYLDKKCSKIDEIIAKQQTVIEKLKEYKLSMITEAVTKGLNPDVNMKDSGGEWIGEIPEHWEITKIKHKAILNPKCDFSNISYDTLITYTPMECIKNGYYNNRTEILSKIPSSLTPFEEGDIVMAKVTPCFENGNIAIMNNLQSKVGLGSSELFVFRSKGILTKYLFYFLQNINFTRQACLTMTGAGGLKRVSSEFCKNCKLPLPPYIEQKQIADYLDSKCEKIDFTINKKQKLIDKLTEYKKSLIYEVVTGKKEV